MLGLEFTVFECVHRNMEMGDFLLHICIRTSYGTLLRPLYTIYILRNEWKAFYFLLLIDFDWIAYSDHSFLLGESLEHSR